VPLGGQCQNTGTVPVPSTQTCPCKRGIYARSADGHTSANGEFESKARAGAEQFEATAGKYTEDVMVVIPAFGGLVLLGAAIAAIAAIAALRNLSHAAERHHNNSHIV
jgi:hypothetical protein